MWHFLPEAVGSHKDHAGANDGKEGLEGHVMLQGLDGESLHAPHAVVGLRRGRDNTFRLV